jgi:hypothetical protein
VLIESQFDLLMRTDSVVFLAVLYCNVIGVISCGLDAGSSHACSGVERPGGSTDRIVRVGIKMSKSLRKPNG